MRKSYLIILMLVLVVFMGVSCKSTPAPDPQEQVSAEALNEAKARAEEARQRAMDFESHTYFPSDWEAIEAQYEAALEMPVTTTEEIQQAISAFDAAAAAYDEIFGKTIPLYAQAREDEIMSVRETLIETRLTRYFPEHLREADDLSLLALDQYEAEDFYTARETAAKALKEYEDLLLGARVYLTRDEIIRRGFYDYDPDNFNRADEVACEALDEFEAGNREAAIAKAEEALLRFNLVLANGWTAYANDRRGYSTNERELAISERANIASRELFREADTLFNQAEENFAAENFHDAAIHFIDAEALFAIARIDTAERRQRAEAAIRSAEEKIEESSETAQEAERIIEGGTR